MRKAIMGAAAALALGGSAYLSSLRINPDVVVIENLQADGGVTAGLNSDGGIDLATGCPRGMFGCADSSCVNTSFDCP